jgi:CheY-like chemotaxis protein
MAIPILVVDDNATNLKLLAFVMRAAGFEVDTANDADGLRARVAARKPSVILMDLQLPGTDGLALTRQLKADPATRDIAIVAVTAYAMKGDREKALAAGCDDYVTKPIDTRTLPELVARHAKRAPA